MKNSTLIFIVFTLISCSSQPNSQEGNQQPGKPTLAAVNYPIYYFAQRIGGKYIQLKYPVPDDVDPAYWIPDDEALNIYQSADVVLSNGADYAKWMNNVSLPTSRIFNTSASIKEKYIPLKNVTTHSHGPEGEHVHTGLAFTTWLDFQIAIAQADAIRKVLEDKLPESKEELDENFASLKKELLALHEQMVGVSDLIGEQNIIASHPVYQYLSQAYRLTIHSVHFEPGEMPSAKQWQEFDHLLEHHPSKIMLWEDEPLSEVKEILSKKGIEVKVFNPCGNRPDGGDFMEIMNGNVNTLLTSL